MPRSTPILAATAALLLMAPDTRGQQPSGPDNPRDVLVAGWNEVGEKLVKLAEEFPEPKYDYQPVETVRTFADVLRHVAFWNHWATKSARGEKPDGKPNELSRSEFASKAAIVAALRGSVAEGADELRKQAASPGPREVGLWTSFIAHSSEHYGQLVVYYRLNGLVPPASRGTP